MSIHVPSHSQTIVLHSLSNVKVKAKIAECFGALFECSIIYQYMGLDFIRQSMIFDLNMNPLSRFPVIGTCSNSLSVALIRGWADTEPYLTQRRIFDDFRFLVTYVFIRFLSCFEASFIFLVIFQAGLTLQLMY